MVFLDKRLQVQLGLFLSHMETIQGLVIKKDHKAMDNKRSLRQMGDREQKLGHLFMINLNIYFLLILLIYVAYNWLF